MGLNRGIKITWLGHACVLLESFNGKRIIIDPWIENPLAPKNVKEIVSKIDYILLTHGHFDHFGNTLELAKNVKAVLANWEICMYLDKKGVKNYIDMNKGGSTTQDEITFIMVGADHSSGILEENMQYGGEAAGWVIVFENGVTVYHAGDTNVFSDMDLIRKLYKPEIVFLPVGGKYTMGIREAGYAAKLIRPRFFIPIHYNTFPPIQAEPRELNRYLKGLRTELIVLNPGEELS